MYMCSQPRTVALTAEPSQRATGIQSRIISYKRKNETKNTSRCATVHLDTCPVRGAARGGTPRHVSGAGPARARRVSVAKPYPKREYHTDSHPIRVTVFHTHSQGSHKGFHLIRFRTEFARTYVNLCGTPVAGRVRGAESHSLHQTESLSPHSHSLRDSLAHRSRHRARTTHRHRWGPTAHTHSGTDTSHRTPDSHARRVRVPSATVARNFL
jgi:hypothetical protein